MAVFQGAGINFKRWLTNLLQNKEDKKESKNISQREKVGSIIELEKPAKENRVYILINNERKIICNSW